MAWPKYFSVDKRIVLLLSASTYESFPRALRELVSNAFDADATQVEINIDRGQRRIEVNDNGTGMTPDEFDFYLRIAGRQRSRSRTTLLGRKRIGQFGIGFLAAFPFCETLQLESTVEGSPTVFRAWIPASRFQPEVNPHEDLTDMRVVGEEFSDERLRLRHYTRLLLTDTSPLLERYFAMPTDSAKRAMSIRSWQPTERLKWELCEILPLPRPSNSALASEAYRWVTNFGVSLNRERLYANEPFAEVLEQSSTAGERVGAVRFAYAIGTSWKAIHPNEARGVRVRLNNVGVGPRTYFDLNVAGRTFSRLHWLAGEVNILEGLDESIALDRDTFTATEDYDQLREFFRTRLRELAFLIEDIDVARRKIDEQTSGSARASTEARTEVVEEQLHRLRQRGFTVREEAAKDGRFLRHAPPVTIDTVNRTVTVRPDHPNLRDTVIVAGSEYLLKFDTWDYESATFKACRIDEDGSMVFNREYPLFKGPHQDIFRKLQAILVQAERASRSKDELFEAVQNLMLKEFAPQ